MRELNRQEMTGSGHSSAGGNGFFAFETMISSSLIKAIYLIGAIGITIISFFIIITSAQTSPTMMGNAAANWGGIILGSTMLVLGNLLWRVFCELLIVIFNINDRIHEIQSRVGSINVSNISESMREPLETATNELKEASQQLTHIEHEIREGVTYSGLQESFRSIAEQLQGSAHHLSSIEGEIKEGVSYGDLRETLDAIAQEFKQSSVRLTVIEENLREGIGNTDLREDFSSIAERLGNIEQELREGLQRIHEEERMSAETGSGSTPASGQEAASPTSSQSGKWAVAGVVVLLITVFMGIPAWNGASSLNGVDLQSLETFISETWAYWTEAVNGITS